MKTLNILVTIVLSSIFGVSTRAAAAPDAAIGGASAQSSCDAKCAGKKHGEKMVPLHRKGWEAAIQELSIQGAEKTKILDLANKIEARMKKAYAAASQKDLDKIKLDANRELKKLLEDRFQWWQDAEHEARRRIITAETGVPPDVR